MFDKLKGFKFNLTQGLIYAGVIGLVLIGLDRLQILFTSALLLLPNTWLAFIGTPAIFLPIVLVVLMVLFLSFSKKEK